MAAHIGGHNQRFFHGDVRDPNSVCELPKAIPLSCLEVRWPASTFSRNYLRVSSRGRYNTSHQDQRSRLANSNLLCVRLNRRYYAGIGNDIDGDGSG